MFVSVVKMQKFVLRIDLSSVFHHHDKFLADLVIVFVLAFPFCED